MPGIEVKSSRLWRQDAIEAGFQALRHDRPAILLHGAQRGELTAADDEVPDELGLGVDGRSDGRLQGGGELGDEAGIDGVGLGELADGAGEAADFEGRDDDDRKTLGQCGPDEGMLEAAGGFQDDTLEAVPTEAADERSNGARLVGDAESAVPLEEIDIQRRLADIDADIHGGTKFCHGYSTLLNSGSGAHSTVRVDTRVDEPLHAC